MPGPLTIEAPSGVRALAEEWTLVMPAAEATERPSRWHAWITLEAIEGGSSAGGSTDTLTDSLGRTQRIGVDGLPVG